MGEWVYYVTCMTFTDVDDWIKRTDEIYKSAKLADWIQRQLDEKHAARIAKYLRENEERLFNSIVVGLYGADPTWAELSIADPRDELTAEQEDYLQRSMGLLRLTGHEKLFAIDGQHRVAGIKEALKTNKKIARDEISVLLVAHKDDAKGKARTRRLFVTLNNTAKKVSAADIVALAEDNGLAVVTRRLVDDFELFQKGGVIAFAGTAAIPEKDKTSITSIITLYEIAKALYPRKESGLPSKTSVLRSRPSASQLGITYAENERYWSLLAKLVPEYRQVFARTHKAGEFRVESFNHLLFRPVGQTAFAGAVRALMDVGREMEDAVKTLLGTELRLDAECWHYVLWDPVHKVMLKNRAIAEALLLLQVGESARSPVITQRIEDLFATLDADHALADGGSRLDLFRTPAEPATLPTRKAKKRTPQAAVKARKL
jgi:DNA sulfur modification protein DndB